ncbi:NAD(P)-dependent oxidoreductase [uncultured Ilumatobacter sp.]|uniref:NAD(P)-dependent oxidoreductase n=1 Tax=uncultured Ilumatobacter sp. TaxID=879968 RepID=UPI00374ECC58
MRVAVIGLGRMGWPIAGHLAGGEHGHEVKVFDISAEATAAWAGDHAGKAVASVADAVSGADVIVSSLPADKEMRVVVDEALAHVGEGAIWIDHSTISASGARQFADELANRRAHFLDAPVSGGVDGARNGSLTVMIGGDEDAFARIESLMAAYAGRVTHMGPSGAGQITKMTNQICVVGVAQALAEGLDFAINAGLDPERVVHVMTQGSSTSWEMENRAAQMIAGEYDFGFSTTLMRKDVGLVLDEASAMNVSLPVTAMVAQFLADVHALGGADWDWCSLMERQRRLSGSAD